MSAEFVKTDRGYRVYAEAYSLLTGKEISKVGKIVYSQMKEKYHFRPNILVIFYSDKEFHKQIYNKLKELEED